MLLSIVSVLIITFSHQIDSIDAKFSITDSVVEAVLAHGSVPMPQPLLSARYYFRCCLDKRTWGWKNKLPSAENIARLSKERIRFGVHCCVYDTYVYIVTRFDAAG